MGKAGQLVGQFASGLTSGIIRQAIGGRVDFVNVAADAFGNALGNSIAAQGGRGAQQIAELDALDREAVTRNGQSYDGPPQTYWNMLAGDAPAATAEVVAAHARAEGKLIITGEGADPEADAISRQLEIEHRIREHGEANGESNPIYSGSYINADGSAPPVIGGPDFGNSVPELKGRK